MIKVILSYFSASEKNKQLFVTTIFMKLSKGHHVSFENQWELAVVAYSYTLSTKEEEAGRSRVQGQC